MKKSRIATLIVFFGLIPLTLIVGSRLSRRAFYVTSTLVIVVSRINATEIPSAPR